MSDSLRPHRRQPTRLPHPWDSPGKNTGVGCHFLLHQVKQVFTNTEDDKSSFSRTRFVCGEWEQRCMKNSLRSLNGWLCLPQLYETLGTHTMYTRKSQVGSWIYRHYIYIMYHCIFYVGLGSVSHSVVSNFATPWTVACQFLCPWNFPGKNPGMDCP